MAETTRIVFNINIKSSFQGKGGSSTPEGAVQEVKDKAYQAVNYAISDIAFKATRAQQRNVQNQLESQFHSIVSKELSNMGRKISKLAIGLGNPHRSPTGRLEIEGPVSQVFKATDPKNVQPMNISIVTGQWRARTQEYLRWKSKKYGHKQWWKNTGDLKKQLMNSQMYLAAYGPIRVTFIPKKVAGVGDVRMISGLARGQGTGRRGFSHRISIGEVRMSVLGRITRQMLNDPDQRSYDSRFNGLLGMLPESVETKLVNRGDPYRPLLEPFLTFYLNRQIPNRIFYALTERIGKKHSLTPLG